MANPPTPRSTVGLDARDLLHRLCQRLAPEQAKNDADDSDQVHDLDEWPQGDVRGMVADDYAGHKEAVLRYLREHGQSPIPPSRRLRAGAPRTGAAYARHFEQELTKAQPLLADLVAREEALASSKLRASELRQRRKKLAEEWNRALRRGRWWTLPTFCESCAQPIFRRWAQIREHGKFVIPTVCSETCRLTRKRLRAPSRAT
jgi:hypothetical protein